MSDCCLLIIGDTETVTMTHFTYLWWHNLQAYSASTVILLKGEQPKKMKTYFENYLPMKWFETLTCFFYFEHSQILRVFNVTAQNKKDLSSNI